MAPAVAEPVNVKVLFKLVFEELTHTAGLVKLLTGVDKTVTATVAGAPVQIGVPGLFTCREIVLVPVVAQLMVCGPAEVPIPPQLLQFQVKVAPGSAMPSNSTVVVVLLSAEVVQTILFVKLILLTGVGFTVITTVVIVERQVGVVLFCIWSVSVFVPGVDQLTLWGPCVVPGGLRQPPQFQV